MRQHEYNTTQQNTSTKRDNMSTMQHKILFWFIYIFTAYLEPGILGSKAVYILKLESWKLLFPVKAKTELENLKATVCCNCVFYLSVYSNNFDCFSSYLTFLTRHLLGKHSRYNITGHSIIMFTPRGERGWTKCKRMQIVGDGEQFYERKSLNVTLFNLVSSP